jgi:hypothetical protein
VHRVSTATPPELTAASRDRSTPVMTARAPTP